LAELVDARGLKPCGFKAVRVRVPQPAPIPIGLKIPFPSGSVGSSPTAAAIMVVFIFSRFPAAEARAAGRQLKLAATVPRWREQKPPSQAAMRAASIAMGYHRN